jgi:hypothetical protein
VVKRPELKSRGRDMQELRDSDLNLRRDHAYDVLVHRGVMVLPFLRQKLIP